MSGDHLITLDVAERARSDAPLSIRSSAIVILTCSVSLYYVGFIMLRQFARVLGAL